MNIIYGESKFSYTREKQQFYTFLKGLKIHERKLWSCILGIFTDKKFHGESKCFSRYHNLWSEP